MRSVQWLCRAFFGLLAFSGLISLIAEASQPGGHIVPAIAICLLFGGLAYFFHRKLQSVGAPAAETLVQETIAFFNRVNEARAFPASQARSLIEKAGEPILLAGPATLYELTTNRVTSGVGTRVKVGGIPLSIGQARTRSVTGTKAPVAGELGLTPRALVFHGADRSLDLPLARLSAVDVLADGFTVSIAGRAKPVTFAVPNGLLWAQLSKNLARLTLDGRTLPDGEQLRAL